MNVFAGALDFSFGVLMYGMRFVLLALVFWLILSSVQDRGRPAGGAKSGRGTSLKA